MNQTNELDVYCGECGAEHGAPVCEYRTNVTPEGWSVDQGPSHIAADKDHRPVPDRAVANCLTCGLAILSNGLNHGFEA